MEHIDSISAQLLLRDAYETSYTIYNHDSEDAHPLALVSMHPKENATEYGPLYRTVYHYRLKDVNKYFGLNLHEFLSLPREYTELIFRIIDEEAARDAQNLANAEEGIKAAESQGRRRQK